VTWLLIPEVYTIVEKSLCWFNQPTTAFEHQNRHQLDYQKEATDNTILCN